MPHRFPSRLKFVLILLCAGAGLGASIAQEEEPLRQWRSSDGKSLIGRLTGTDGKTVTLDVKGRSYTLEIARLSEEDREYVKSREGEIPRSGESGGGVEIADLPPWPRKYDGTGKVTLETVREDPGASSFVYQTEHFRFAFDRKLPGRNLEEIAAVFESVSAALSSLPITLLRPRLERNRRFPTIFFSREIDFLKAGGLSGSVGVYDMRRQAILIRLDVLMANENRGSNLPRRERYQVLVHELTHQAMYPAQLRMPIWYSEGVAEYMSAAHFATARFDFQNIAQHIRDHVRRFVTADSDGGFTLPPIESVFHMEVRAWNDDNRQSGREAIKKYITALLLTHWFHHRHGNGKAQEMDAYLNGIAKTRKWDNVARETILAGGKTLADLQKNITEYWSSQGLKLRFRE